MGSPAASASDRRLRTTTPQPSPRTKPLPRASKVLQRPSGASAWARDTLLDECGERMRLTPHASAIEHSWLRRLWEARCSATSDDEHAVSTTRQGPWKSRRYESRPDTTQLSVPVTLLASRAEGFPICSSA